MKWDELLTLFGRMIKGDQQAQQSLADYLHQRGKQARAGNRMAEDELATLAYQIMYQRVRALLEAKYSYLLDRGGSAASVVSEAWLRLAKPAPPPPDNPKALCLLVASMVGFVVTDIVNKLRKWDRRHFVPAADHPSSTEAQGLSLGQLEDKDAEDQPALATWTAFHEGIAALPDDVQEVFRLGYYAGLSREAIAQQLGVTVYYVRVRWNKALCLLHDVLPEQI
jgi:RNA polymerase sigma factor (sigma-70 family)